MNYGNIKNATSQTTGRQSQPVCIRLPPSLQGLFQCGDVGFPIWTVIYRRDGERDFSGIGSRDIYRALRCSAENRLSRKTRWSWYIYSEGARDVSGEGYLVLQRL